MLATALFTHPDNITLIEAEFALPLFIKNLPAVLSVLGAGFALLLYHQYPGVLVSLTESRLGLATYKFFNSKWAIDVIYNRYIIEPALGLGLQTSKVLDRGAVELLGPFGLTQSLYGSSLRIASADTGVISTYGLFIFIGALSLTLILFAPVLGPMISGLGDIRVVLMYAAALFYIVQPSTSNTQVQ